MRRGLACVGQARGWKWGVILGLVLELTGSVAAATLTFKLPIPTPFIVDLEAVDGPSQLPRLADPKWIEGRRAGGDAGRVVFGDRVVLQLSDPATLHQLLAGRPLAIARSPSRGLHVLQAPDAAVALREAAALASAAGVVAAYPSFREQAALDGAYADFPNDKYYYLYFRDHFLQWHLESRDPATEQLSGYDLNARSAWAVTRGGGMTIAVVDQGVQVTHPDLVERAAGAPHHDFTDGTDNPLPYGRDASFAHGTAVAGLAAATLNNQVGLGGMAPEAGLASWVIFATNGLLASDERLMDMFQYASNQVAVQNHSWSKAVSRLVSPTPLEQVGLSNALTFGRRGRGVVMVRSGGNRRIEGDNANDDAYVSDPGVIAVAAARPDGRVASYGEPGACLLVAAPSSDSGFPGLFTTDLTGTDGINWLSFLPPFADLSDYAYGGVGFSGTSAAAPQIAGLVALMLSANPLLGIRDVQQILVLSARQVDAADPDLQVNGAGLRVSHNQGLGVPDAGEAVRLALAWSNRPPAVSITFSNLSAIAIPDDGLRVELTGAGVPASLLSVRAITSTGPHADDPMPFLPLVDCGLCTNLPAVDLTGKGALILRGVLPPYEKADWAARAGAAFAVVYNYLEGDPQACPGGDQLCPVGGADFVPIPVVFIGHTDGTNMLNVIGTNPAALARIHLDKVERAFDVTSDLRLEHVGVRLKTDHPLRGDLRITLVSPAGTRSILQRFNADVEAGPVDWTYWTTHHFYESSRGRWRVELADEFAGAIGNVLEVDLILRGEEIADSDADGLEDAWERRHFEGLSLGPRDDPDGDGSNNAREQAVGSDPLAAEVAFSIDMSVQRPGRYRLSWPATETMVYQVWGGGDVARLSLLTNVPGKFPEAEWTVSGTNPPARFFRVKAVPR